MNGNIIKKLKNYFLPPVNYNFKPTNGFTMVELLVAMSVFVIIVSIASGVFVKSLRTQRIVAAAMAANSNAQLALEQISREIRTGKTFVVANGGTDSAISFINAKSENVIYSWDSNDKSLLRSVNGGTAEKMTANNVDIGKLTFILFSGSMIGDYPPRITILMQVAPNNVAVGQRAPVNIQTTVSSRNIN